VRSKSPFGNSQKVRQSCLNCSSEGINWHKIRWKIEQIWDAGQTSFQTGSKSSQKRDIKRAIAMARSLGKE
jgi:hypothetical protein